MLIFCGAINASKNLNIQELSIQFFSEENGNERERGEDLETPSRAIRLVQVRTSREREDSEQARRTATSERKHFELSATWHAEEAQLTDSPDNRSEEVFEVDVGRKALVDEAIPPTLKSHQTLY